MARKIAVGFETRGRGIPLERLLPLRHVDATARQSEKYRCIAASMREIGMVEPLIVYPQAGASVAGGYTILDGNTRYAILRELGQTEAFCLIATDDEAYTYNHKVNALSPIQEHFMILRAIEQGVSEERIAATLSVDVGAIRRKRDLLEGVCPEAVALLKDRRVSPDALRELKRVVPLRQIEMAELMCSVNNVTASYTRCLFAATPDEQRLPEVKSKKDEGLGSEERARMHREMQSLQRELKLVERTYSHNVLHLVVSARYVQSLLENARVAKSLQARYPEIVDEFRQITRAPELQSPLLRDDTGGG